MRRTGDIAVALRGAPRIEQTLAMKLADVTVTAMASFAAALVLFDGTWHPHWVASFVAFAFVALGLTALRALGDMQDRFPRMRIFHTLGNFWLLPTVIIGHFSLGPIVDSAHPRLLDAELAQLDLRLFGVHPSLWLGDVVGPVITEFVMLCYYGYFLGPVILGALLLARRRTEAYGEYVLGLALYFCANYAFYVVVPAVGPRFFLAQMFDQPLNGLWLTSTLDGLMRTPIYNRDCFPSGHTGVTITVLVYAWRYHRRFFWIWLPVGVGLISATLIGRFHYGIDLLAALPLVVTVVAVSAVAARAAALGVPERALRAVRNLART